MRFLILIFCAVFMSGCSLFSPSATPAPNPPSPIPTSQSIPPIATKVALSSLPADLVTYGPALRPEFETDLSLVKSPTLYRMNLSLDPSLTNLAGEESVTFTNRTGKALNVIYFRLFANYPAPRVPDRLIIKSFQMDGSPAETVLESQDTALRVPLRQDLAPNQTIKFELSFTVDIPSNSQNHYSDFTDTEGIITLPSVYPIIPAYDDKGWHTELPPLYGDMVYADTSLYDVNFSAPLTMTVITSGSTVATSTNGNLKTWHVVGGPMRDFDFDASANLEESSSKVGEVTVNSYYLPQDKSGGKNVLDWASNALRIYEKSIGPYPFNELDVVETPTTAGGIEYPGLVVVSSELYRDAKQNNYFEFAVVHEVAHQWWYAQVGDDQVNNPWMDEAFAQYTSLLYFRDAYGAQTSNDVLKTVFQSQYDRAKKGNEDMPVGLPVSAYTERQYGEIVYGKGPLFFDAVHTQIGDEKFGNFLRTYYERFKYQIATPEDMLKTMNEASGQQVDALFNQWILGK